MGNRRVGVINRLAGDRHLFAFEQDYFDDPVRSTLSLSFKGPEGALASDIRSVQRRLPPFFSNLLPEGRLRTYLADRAGVSPEREFSLLASLGADLAGAVRVEPGGAPAADFGGQAPEDDAPGDEGADGVLRFSLAGVQLKFSAIEEAHGGLTIPAGGGGGSWIVKLPSTHHPAVAENEFAMLALARAVGIRTPESRLVAISEIRGLPSAAARMEGSALAVRRFDRGAGGRRIHMEDFAQVFGVFPEAKYKGYSYSNIAAVLWAEAGPEDLYEFVRRVVFSAAIGNGDMHLKNWSLLYADGRTPTLSPAYDFVSKLPYIPGDKLALRFGGSREMAGFDVERVRRIAERARLPVDPVWQVVRQTKERTVEAWRGLAEKDLLPAAIREVIGEQIERTIR